VNKREVAELLAIISGLDRFQAADRIAVEAWSLLPDIEAATFEDAKQAVVDHFTAGAKNLTAGDLNARLRVVNRLDKEAIAADVRSARARKLIADTWPETKPVPKFVQSRLAELREEARMAAPDIREITDGDWDAEAKHLGVDA
jgi:hypothetical protein